MSGQPELLASGKGATPSGPVTSTSLSADRQALDVILRNTSGVALDPTIPASASAATLSNVNASASNVTLLAANTSRKGAEFFNDSTAALYLKCGATASTSSFTVKIPGGGFYELPAPVYSGIVDGIWDSATGAVRVTERT